MTVPPDELLQNVHSLLMDDEKVKGLDTGCIKGTYAYYHYLCDNLDDTGWGCGYRTCQTLCSWIHYQKAKSGEKMRKGELERIQGLVPSISEIQRILVKLGDKCSSFVSSREWIGSVEIALCIDHIYDVPCRLIHILPGQLHGHLAVLTEHFRKFGSPVMMGGDRDNASKGILGVAVSPKSNSAFLLTLDPHCSEKPQSARNVIDQSFVSWRKVSNFNQCSFYNLCLPQMVCRNAI